MLSTITSMDVFLIVMSGTLLSSVHWYYMLEWFVYRTTMFHVPPAISADTPDSTRPSVGK